MELLQSIIDVPHVKTVIQLSDIRDGNLRERLTEEFVLTSEVHSHLKTLLRMMEENEGAGVFLEGNFGSGKSHFLTVMSLIFNHKEAWQPLLTQEPDLTHAYESLSFREYLTAEVSLVEYGSKNRLEDIVSKSIAETCLNKDIPLFDDPETLPDRKAFFGRLEQGLQTGGVSGVLLLIDELSEFLRSKPDSRSFNEDIRFLQYLGEKAQSFPMWILATLQESIEDTGQTTQEAFNKIKDRYPLRLFLTGTHIEQLISKRLIHIKDEKREIISELYNTFKAAFPRLPVDEEQFISLYPVHPATVSFLDNLKPLFSQHRGVVDFIHYQLKGDPGRGIEGMGHLPCDHLLMPDRIFDHFRVRIKERVELNPFIEVVYKYYEDEMSKLFQDETDLNLAFRIVKVLILAAISPVRKRLVVKDIAEMLLYRITELESSINYQFVSDILERLHNEGAYISMDKGRTPLEDHFHINLEADISLLVKRSTEYQIGSFFEDDVRLFSRLKELLDDPRLPLKEYEVSTPTKVRFLWQSSSREGIFILEQMDKLIPERLDDMIGELNTTEADFAVIMGTTHRLDQQRSHLEETVLPHLREANAHYVKCWLPCAIEQDGLRETLAHMLLLDKYRDDATERGNEIRCFIEGLLAHEKRLIKENFMDAYHKGSLFSISSGEEPVRESMKFQVFQDFLAHMGEALLEARFPMNREIAPYTYFATKDQFQEVVEDLLKKGEVTLQKGTRHGFKRVVEGFLIPMNVARSIPGGFRMSVEPKKSVPVERFLGMIPSVSGGEKVSPEAIFLKLRKGDLGLSRPQFDLLFLVLIFSGHITPYSGGRRKNPDEVSVYNLKNINGVTRGEIMSGEFQKELSSLPFISRKHKNKELNFLTQKDLWKELLEIRGRITRDVETLREKTHRASEYKALAGFDLGELNKTLDALGLLFNEVKISYGPKEGIERFLSEARNHPFLEKSYHRFEAAKRFFGEDLDRFLFVATYIDHPDLFPLPEGESYETVRTHLEGVKDHLTSGTPYLEEGYMDRLNRLFDNFLQEYTVLYQREHKSAASPEIFSRYSRVRDSLRYKILSGFSKIEYISVQNDRVKVERLLADASSTRCSDFSPEALRSKPVCRCRFRLGQRPELPSVQTIESTIDRGIEEYLLSFKEPANRERFISYNAGLNEVGKKGIADKITSLLDFDLSHMKKDPEGSLKKVERDLDNTMIKAINDAFSGKVVVVLRDLDEFYENIIDRSFPKERLLSIFQEWLQAGEDLKGETYIKITGSKRGASSTVSTSSAFGLLSEGIHERYPELTDIYRQLGNEEFNLVVFLSLWARNHHMEEHEYQRLLSEIVGGQAGDILSRWPALVALADHISTRGSEAENLMEEAEICIKDRGFDDTLFETVKRGGTPSEYFNVIEREDVFFFPLIQAFRHTIKRLEQGPSEIPIKAVQDALARQRGTLHFKRMKKEDIFKTLIHLIRLETALHSLTHDRSEEESHRFWEKTYLSSLCGLSYDYACIHDSLNQLGLLDEIHLYKKKKAVDTVSKTWAKAFQDFYLNVLGPPRSKDKRVKKRPMRITDVPDTLFEKFKKASGKNTGYFILLDGMRWDLWEHIKENTFIAQSLHYRILEEGFLWANHPTTTDVQIRSLLDSTSQLDMVADIGASYTTIRGAESPLTDAYDEIELDNNIKIVKFGFIDNKVHQSKDDLITLFREICVNMDVSVKNYMDRLPKGSFIFLFSDHGFVENLQFSGHKDEPRYLHGGASPWEVIVPFSAMLKI